MRAFKMMLGCAAVPSNGTRFLLQKFGETAHNIAAAHFGANKIMECSVNQLRARAFIDFVSRNSQALLSSITSRYSKALNKGRPLPANPNQIIVHQTI